MRGLLRSTLLCAGAFFACDALPARAASPSPLAAAGRPVLPAPQQVTLDGGDVRVGDDWHVAPGPGIPGGDVSVDALVDGLAERGGLRLAVSDKPDAAGPAIRLVVRPGTVEIGLAQDREKDAVAAQAYRLDLKAKEITITANGPAGLFYGVETLVQLARRRDGGGVSLPAGEITDWPDLQLRELYWDDAHHLDRLDALKHAIRQAAFFKINGFVLKLEGHFQFSHAPALVEPQALSPQELQELTDYGLRYHVQLIPYLDAPAHVAFILKHPEYADLREFPDNNYEMCTTNPKTYELLRGMCQDLLDANRGVRYFYLSTDEPYYVGKADGAGCDEVARLRELGSPGKMLAEFLDKTAGWLHEHGRTVVFWGEYPLKPADVQALPPWLVNGETNGPEFDAAFKARGIRQMIYTSTEGEEKLFPDYFILPADRRLHPPGREDKPRVATAVAAIASDPAGRSGDLTGVLVAGWADMGLHPETFWLGYATIGAAGWNPAEDARSATADFYPLFYGSSAKDMGRVYELMSRQAQFWSDSWESTRSAWRKPIRGNSQQIFRPPHPAGDQVLPLPPAPSPDALAYEPGWAAANARRLELAGRSLGENDELMRLLDENLGRVEFNRYNLEVFQSVARICRHNLQLIRDVGRIEGLLDSAHKAAAGGEAARAVAALDEAIDVARDIRRQRNQVLREATETWYRSWWPRVAEANGRKFLHELDDVKDHLPDRTVGMEYLVYRELLPPMGKWVQDIQAARNTYAKAHGLAERNERIDWEATE